MAALCWSSFAKKIPTFPFSLFTKCRCRRFVRNSNPSVSGSSGRSNSCRGSTLLFFHQANDDGSVSSIQEVRMRRIALCLFVMVFVTGVIFSQSPAPSSNFQNIGTMSQLMQRMIYPTSNDIFYIERKPPQTDYDWG